VYPIERTAMLSSILQKPLGAITVLGTAIGGPYALFETEAGTAARQAIQGMLDASPSGQTPTPATGGSVSEAGAPLPHSMLLSQNPSAQATVVAASTVQQPPPVWTPPPIVDLREVIRFDMTPTALPQRFAQVTTVTGNPQYDAYRVPLVTGTGPTDLAGTLTYAFDANKAVQRIQFMGTTGDPSMVAGMMVHFYGLRPEASLGGQLFTTRWNNRVTSVLHIRPASVITAGSTNGNYHVFLELNQPSTYYGLSEEAYREAGIAPARAANSWFGF
jgi:hypothetical protein